MKIKDIFDDNKETFYTVELEEDVFVDVKRINDLYYVMDCDDGFRAFDSSGNSFDYNFNENEVIEFVKSEIVEWFYENYQKWNRV